MRTQQDRIRRVRERLHTATQNIDDSVNLDLEEYGEVIVASVNREVIGILSELHDSDLKEIYDAIGEYFQC